MVIEGNKYMTVKEYAVKNGITVQAVYQKIWADKIGTRKIGSMILVRVD